MIMIQCFRQHVNVSDQEVSHPFVQNIDFDERWNLQKSSEISVIALEV
jgi:hypothetical protein